MQRLILGTLSFLEYDEALIKEEDISTNELDFSSLVALDNSGNETNHLS